MNIIENLNQDLAIIISQFRGKYVPVNRQDALTQRTAEFISARQLQTMPPTSFLGRLLQEYPRLKHISPSSRRQTMNRTRSLVKRVEAKAFSIINRFRYLIRPADFRLSELSFQNLNALWEQIETKDRELIGVYEDILGQINEFGLAPMIPLIFFPYGRRGMPVHDQAEFIRKALTQEVWMRHQSGLEPFFRMVNQEQVELQIEISKIFVERHEDIILDFLRSPLKFDAGQLLAAAAEQGKVLLCRTILESNKTISNYFLVPALVFLVRQEETEATALVRKVLQERREIPYLENMLPCCFEHENWELLRLTLQRQEAMNPWVLGAFCLRCLQHENPEVQAIGEDILDKYLNGGRPIDGPSFEAIFQLFGEAGRSDKIRQMLTHPNLQSAIHAISALFLLYTKNKDKDMLSLFLDRFEYIYKLGEALLECVQTPSLLDIAKRILSEEKKLYTEDLTKVLNYCIQQKPQEFREIESLILRKPLDPLFLPNLFDHFVSAERKDLIPFLFSDPQKFNQDSLCKKLTEAAQNKQWDIVRLIWEKFPQGFAFSVSSILRIAVKDENWDMIYFFTHAPRRDLSYVKSDILCKYIEKGDKEQALFIIENYEISPMSSKLFRLCNQTEGMDEVSLAAIRRCGKLDENEASFLLELCEGKPALKAAIEAGRLIP